MFDFGRLLAGILTGGASEIGYGINAAQAAAQQAQTQPTPTSTNSFVSNDTSSQDTSAPVAQAVSQPTQSFVSNNPTPESVAAPTAVASKGDGTEPSVEKEEVETKAQTTENNAGISNQTNESKPDMGIDTSAIGGAMLPNNREYKRGNTQTQNKNPLKPVESADPLVTNQQRGNQFTSGSNFGASDEKLKKRPSCFLPKVGRI